MSEKKIKYAFIHGCYVESRANDKDDAVVVKRYAIHPDGTRVPEVVIHHNVMRDFYITKEPYRKHQDGKLEYEYLNRLEKGRCTQRALIKTLQRKLGMIPNSKTTLRNICNSPFIYGVDKDITCVVHDIYKKQYPDVEPFDHTVGCMDTETNVVDGSNDIIIKTFYTGNTAVAAIDENWLKDKRHTPEVIKKFIEDNIPEIKEMGINVEIALKKTPAECVIHTINRAHDLKPDLIGFWNINFDMPLIINALKKEGHNPLDIFTAPEIAKEFRGFRYKEGQTSKLTDSGKYKPLAPSEQWHTVLAPMGSYFVDPSSVYRCLRRQKSEPSYGLDFITNKIVGSGKMKPDLPELVNIEGTLKWHQVMQKQHQLWYIAYALFDVIRPVQMDRITGDLAKKLPTLSMGSHYKDFNSNPRRLCDQLDGFFLSKGAVVGTTGEDMESPLDKYIPASKDWIVTLEAPIIEDFGLPILTNIRSNRTALADGLREERKNIIIKDRISRGVRRSKIFIHNADLDIVSTYPILGMVFNIARETALFETCKIEGLGYHEYREFGINLTAGKANAVIIGEEVFGLKGFEDLLEDFENHHNLPSTKARLEDEWNDQQMRKKARARQAAIRSAQVMPTE